MKEATIPISIFNEIYKSSNENAYSKEKLQSEESQPEDESKECPRIDRT